MMHSHLCQYTAEGINGSLGENPPIVGPESSSEEAQGPLSNVLKDVVFPFMLNRC